MRARSHRFPAVARRRRGSILAATFFLSLLGAMTALWLAITLMDHQRQNVQRRALSHAFLAADSGVQLVFDWGNHPEEYDAGGPSGRFFRDSHGNFPNLTAASLGSGLDVPAEKLASLQSKYGVGLASIESLRIEPSGVDDPPSLVRVVSVGRSVSGTGRRVVAHLDANPLPTVAFALPAGLLSLASAAQAGNGTVHWGEAWSKQNFNVLNRSQCDYLDNTDSEYDPWAKYRTEGRLLFPNNWDAYEAGDNINGTYDVNTTVRHAGAASAANPRITGDFATGFEQTIPPGVLVWPDLLSKYQIFKDQAKSHGRYYGTDSSGRVYRDRRYAADGTVLAPGVQVDFNAEFGEAHRETSPYDLVFIDTTDGKPPRYGAGTNLATVQNSGTGIGMKGVFWIGANFAQTGAGNPASLSGAEKPDLTKVTISKVYLDGVLYAAGTASFGGNPVIFGSLVAEKGYVGAGTPEIYYNHKLAQGLELPTGNIGSVFYTVRHHNEAVDD